MNLLSLAACLALASSALGGTEIPSREYEKYHFLITGRMPSSGSVRFSCDPGLSTSGTDAYALRSDERGVVLTGSNERSLLYAVYDLLERRGGCRWFWDGDVVPKKVAIDLTGLDVREESQFEFRAIRYFAHRGLKRFQAEHWGFEDWKREIDWCLKKRLNTFMLRIGQDDLFQRAYPDVVPYPDPAKDLPGHGKGYDNRTLFWSLQYRGELRKRVLDYAFARGMMVPEDFGTMSHWYSRTPPEFLERMNPTFVPQASTNYAEKSGLVWDIREDRWLDAYWKLTETAIREHGKADLLHTIGLGERMCYRDRTENFKFKRYVLDRLFGKAESAYPDSRVLLAGWDFFHSWNADEVRALIPSLDPKRVLIWDYEADAYGRTNFTEWDVIGKFPYTFGIFLTLEQGLDVRADYSIIESRERLIAKDPYCKGYIFWPESSHTDPLLIEYFAKNSWRAGTVDHNKLLPRFCEDRYGDQAHRMEDVWRTAVPVSTVNPDLWCRNYGKHSYHLAEAHPKIQVDFLWTNGFPRMFKDVPRAFRALSEVKLSDEFVKRDVVDLARTMADRLLIVAQATTMSMFRDWQENGADACGFEMLTRCWKGLADAMADLLALHPDYSLYETYCAVDAIESVKNPNFQHVLVENALNSYCASHQAELARNVWCPLVRDWCDAASARIAVGDHTGLGVSMRTDYIGQALSAELKALRPMLPRTDENYSRVLLRMECLALELLPLLK